MSEHVTPNVSILTLMWDRDTDAFSINYEGLNYFEAVGLLAHASYSIEAAGEIEEVDDDV